MDPREIIAGRTRETHIRRDAAGRWWNGEDRIDHAGVCRSFDGWIERTVDGRLCLANEINWAYIEVEGAPYSVRSVRWDGENAVLTLSGDRVEALDPRTLRTGPDGALYCDVQEGTLAARFDNHAAMQLAERLEEGASPEVFRIGGKLHPAPPTEDPLAPSVPHGKRAP